MWRLQMCLLFNYEHLLDPGMTVTFTNVLVVYYEHLLDTLACDIYKCVCCLTMNIYLIPWPVTFTNVFIV